MFEKGRFIRCKEESDYRFGITTSKAICEVINGSVFIDGNSLSKECNEDDEGAVHGFCVKIIKHSENKHAVGTIVYLEDCEEEHFEDVTEEVGVEIRDEGRIVRKWDIDISEATREISDTHRNKIGNTFSSVHIDRSDFNAAAHTYIKTLMLPLYMHFGLKDTDGEMYNSQYSYVSLIRCIDDYSLTSTLDDMLDAGSVNIFAILSDDKDVFDKMQIDELFEYLYNQDFHEVEIKDEYKIKHFESFEYKACVYSDHEDGNNVYNYVIISNSQTLETLNRAFLAIYENIGMTIPDEVKQGILNIDLRKTINGMFEGYDEYIIEENKAKRERKLNMFYDKYKTFGKEGLASSIETIKRNISSKQQELARLFRSLHDNSIKLFYLKNGIEGKESELETFLKGMGDNLIYAECQSDRYLIFDVVTRMSVWDDDMYKIVRKSDSNFKRLSDAGKQLLDDIFLTRKLNLLIEQKFCIDSRGDGHAASKIDFNYDNGEGITGMPHPHINEYDCWGTHKSAIDGSVISSDYMSAVAQCITCLSGITWEDSAVSEKFINYYIGDDSRYNSIACIEDPETGKRMTLKQYKNAYKESGEKWSLGEE